LINDGCIFQIPASILGGLSDDTEIRYIFVVAEKVQTLSRCRYPSSTKSCLTLNLYFQQNPYTFGYQKTSLSTDRLANITTRVPSFQLKFGNNQFTSFSDLTPRTNLDPELDWIKLTMAPSERLFLDDSTTTQVVQSSSYSAWVSEEYRMLVPDLLEFSSHLHHCN